MHNEDWPPLRLSLSRPSPYGLGRPAMGFRRQFAQQPVAGGLDDAAAMLGDLWVNNLGAERLEPGQSPFLVGFDQARTARYIGGEDRREPTFDATWLSGPHGASLMAYDPTPTSAPLALSKEDDAPEAKTGPPG
jgi:hypothetical protein